MDGVQKKDSSLLRRLADPLRMTVVCEARGEENSGAAAILFPSLYYTSKRCHSERSEESLYILIQPLDINVIPNEMGNLFISMQSVVTSSFRTK